MSTDGDERNTSTAHADADGLPLEGAGQEGGSVLSRVVISRLGWVQRAVSPWVRRALEAGQASSPAGRDAAGRRVSTALSYSATSRFLRRAQRFVEGSRSWQPALGSLDPRSVARFTEEVTARFPDPVRHQVTWVSEEEADHATEFPLAGQVQPPPGRAVGEIRLPAMPASRSSAPQVPPVAGTARSAAASPTTVQRAPVRRAPPPRPTKPPPTGRLFSHVEELPVTRQKAVPEGDLDELAIPAETPDRAAEQPPGAGEQVQRAVDAARPSEEAVPWPEAPSGTGIQRQARSMPPAAGGDAGRRVPRQSEASRPAGPAPPPRAGTPQQHADEELQPPSPARVSPRGIPPATQRAAEQQGALQAAEPSVQGEAIERTASPPAPFPPGPDRTAQGGHPERDQEEARTLEMPAEVAPRPAHAQLPPQERDTPPAQRRTTPSTQAGATRQGDSPSPDRPTALSQAATTPPDQPRAVQQVETPAVQPSLVQEEPAASLAAPEGKEPVARFPEEEGRAGEAPAAADRAQLKASDARAATRPAASRGALDRPMPVQRREESDRGQATEGRRSTTRRAEQAPLQREPSPSARAPSVAAEAGSSTQARGAERQQEQGAPQVERRSSAEVVQPAPDQVGRAAVTQPPAAYDEAPGAPEPQAAGETVQQPPEGRVVQPAPGERASPPAGAEGWAPAAGRGAALPHDGAARLPEAMQERGDQLPLAAAPRAPAQRAAVPGKSETGEPTGMELEAPPGAEGGPVAQRQPDRATPPGSATRRRSERLPLAQRESAEPGVSSQAPQSRDDKERLALPAEKPVPATDGAVGRDQEPEAPGRDQLSTTRADVGALAGPAREPPVSRTVQRAVEPPISPAVAEPAPEAVGTSAGEGLPGGGAAPEDAAVPLQRQAAGQERPVGETLPPGAAELGGARPAPWREQPSRRPPGIEPGVEGEPESAPLAMPFVSPRPVVQTKPLAETAILPQVRRAPLPGARAAEGRAHAPPPPLVQRTPLPVEGQAAAVGAVPAPVAPVATLQPPPQLSGQAIVQRQPSAAPIVSQPDVGETAAVQRAEEEPSAEGQGQDKEKDLDRLARDVYPLVKRLLAIERERRTGRWG